MFNLFVESLKVTTGLVLNFLTDMFKFLIIVVAAALPLFIVLGILWGIGLLIETIKEKSR